MLLGLAAAFQGCDSGGGGGSGYSSDECSDACNKVAAADCGDVGSSCFDACVSFPNAQYTGDCQLQLKGYFECWWKAELYSCDAKSQTQPVGCDPQRSTYLACTGETEAGGNDAGGAGGSAGAPEDASAGAGGASEMSGAAGAADAAGSSGMAGAAGQP